MWSVNDGHMVLCRLCRQHGKVLHKTLCPVLKLGCLCEHKRTSAQLRGVNRRLSVERISISAHFLLKISTMLNFNISVVSFQHISRGAFQQKFWPGDTLLKRLICVFRIVKRCRIWAFPAAQIKKQAYPHCNSAGRHSVFLSIKWTEIDHFMVSGETN